MNPERAQQLIADLRLKLDDNAVWSPGPVSESWVLNVRSVLSRALGSDSPLVRTLDHIRFYPAPVLRSAYADETSLEQERISTYESGIEHVQAVIDSALFEFASGGGDATRPSAANIDHQLWAHVRKLVESADWQNLPAAVAIFVESKIRTWGEFGRDVYGKVLYQRAFADDAELRLGATRGEWEGWRALGTGLALAVGNSDRHHIQQRGDMEQYAMGTLGLGSLLLTQLRHQHPEVVEARDSGASPSETPPTGLS